MNNSGRSELLHLARLINKFRLSTDPAEIYDLAILNYNTLLDIIENQKSVVKLALIAEKPVSKVRETADAILDSLLFNKNNDPYISLGLRGNEDNSMITKRWRQLITLFHPDKYPNNKIYEERAKRINEAYEEIRRSKEGEKKDKHIYFGQNDQASEIIKKRYARTNGFRSKRTEKIVPLHYQASSKFLINLPLIIIAIMLFISFVSVLFLIKKL